MTFPGNISISIRSRKLVRSKDIGSSWRCTTSWCDLDLTFDIALVTLTFKILSLSWKLQGVGNYYMAGILAESCNSATLFCDLGLTFGYGSAKMFLLPYWRHISPNRKIYGLLQLITIYTSI